MHPLYILRISSTASESSISSLSITATIEIKLSYEQQKLAHYTSLIWSNNQALDKITMQGRRNLIFQHVENTPSILRCRNFIILKPCSTGELHHILTWICWFIQFAQNISRYIVWYDYNKLILSSIILSSIYRNWWMFNLRTCSCTGFGGTDFLI